MKKAHYLALAIISVATVTAAQAQLLHKNVVAISTIDNSSSASIDEPLITAVSFIKQKRAGIKNAQFENYKPRHSASTNFITGGAEALPM